MWKLWYSAGEFKTCNWLPSRYFVPCINHLHPVCCSIFFGNRVLNNSCSVSLTQERCIYRHMYILLYRIKIAFYLANFQIGSHFCQVSLRSFVSRCSFESFYGNGFCIIRLCERRRPSLTNGSCSRISHEHNHDIVIMIFDDPCVLLSKIYWLCRWYCLLFWRLNIIHTGNIFLLHDKLH